ncbi:MAG: Sec-independent protein translocase protein TatB [Thermodesulfovibrionales bacterium]|nr:Sec-independent protein translocase protein TatB [Thermodesulfovibrionales bacterium]
MFDIGFQELVIIFVVALIVFGPKRLPEIAKTLGKGVGELKRAMDNVRDQIHSEVKDIKDPLDLKNELYGKPQNDTTYKNTNDNDSKKENQPKEAKNTSGDNKPS